MRFNGQWRRCDDGMVRPVIRGEILASDGSRHATEFLVDTGADRTVISADALKRLKLPLRDSDERIGGIGGLAESVTIAARLRLRRDDDEWVTFRGEYAACMNYEILDMSVLGRDILNLFAVIVHRAANVRYPDFGEFQVGPDSTTGTLGMV